MAGVEGKTGNPGQRNPKKRGAGSFRVLRSEPKGSNLCFRPPQSLEGRIKEVLQKSGLKMAEFLELAANAYLERSPEQMQRELEQLLEAEQFSIDPSKPLPKNVRKAAISLEKSPAEAGGNSQQGQLDSSSLAEEPAATASDEAPASGRLNAGGQEEKAGNTKTSRVRKASPRPGAKARKTASS